MSGSVVRSVAFTELPTSLDRLIGREADLERAERHFQNGFERLLTVSGPGGSGKTRFALALAQRLASGFRDGVVLIDLSAQREAAQIPVEVVRVLNARASGFSESQSLEQILGNKAFLLILDNLEQIAGAGAPITTLLERFPNLHLLVTSRTVLGIRGERRFPLQPLPCVAKDGRVGSAVELFLERSKAVNPDLELTEGNEPVLVRLCQRLDGLPLALELAAARGGLYSPAGLLALLEQDGNLSLPGRPERHSSLERLLTWSWDLLEGYECALLRRLSVFEGAFDADAAAAVAGEFGVATLGALSRLAEHHLLVALPGETLCFRLLETVRVYALGKLELMGETAQTRDRHAAHYGSKAEAVYGTLYETTFEWSLTELDWAYAQYESALIWIIETEKTLLLNAAFNLVRLLNEYDRRVNHNHEKQSNQHHQGSQLIERLISLLPIDWIKERIELKIILISIIYLDDVSANLTVLESLKEEASLLENVLLLAKVFFYYAFITIKSGSLSKKLIFEQLEILKKLNLNPHPEAKLQKANGYTLLAHHHYILGDFPCSLFYFEKALNASKMIKTTLALVNGLQNVGLLRFTIHQDKSCLTLIEEALEVTDKIGFKKMIGGNHLLLGELNLAFGNIKSALAHANVTIEQNPISSRPDWLWRARAVKAHCSLEQNLLHDAWTQAVQSFREALAKESSVFLNLAALTLSDVLLRSGFHTESAKWLGYAKACFAAADPTIAAATGAYIKHTRTQQRERLEHHLIALGFDIAARSVSAEQLLEWLEQDSLSMADRVLEFANSQDADLPQATASPTEAESRTGLSPRETEILTLLAQGQTNKQIAQSLTVSPSTIETHLKRLFIKLEVRTRAQAVSCATELGWL